MHDVAGKVDELRRGDADLLIEAQARLGRLGHGMGSDANGEGGEGARSDRRTIGAFDSVVLGRP